MYPNADYMWGQVSYRVRMKGYLHDYYETEVLCDGIYDSKYAWKAAWKQCLKDILNKFEDA